jgi:hypothetical protein
MIESDRDIVSDSRPDETLGDCGPGLPSACRYATMRPSANGPGLTRPAGIPYGQGPATLRGMIPCDEVGCYLDENRQRAGSWRVLLRRGKLALWADLGSSH